MNSIAQNQKAQEEILAHINNRISIRNMYQDRNITTLNKPQNIISNMVDSKMTSETQMIYENMKQELSQKGYGDFKYLAKGAQGCVLLAKKGDRRYVIKGVLIKVKDETDHDSLRQVESEIKLLNACKGSPYVLNLLDSFEGQQFKFLVFTECQGTLRQIIEETKDKKLNELSAIKYAKDIAEGLTFIHSKSCIINDIKMDNILIDYNGNAVVSDFGFADSLPNKSGYSIHEFAGNFYFQAPECYDPQQFDLYAVEYQKLGIVTKTTPSQRSEACSLGYLIYTMISGMKVFELPFNKHLPLVYNSDFQQFIYYKQLKHIIDGLTKFNPRERLTVKDAMLMLKGIISLEFNLEERFTQLINQETQQALSQSYKQMEFIECFQNQYYPIIQNEGNLAQEIQKALDDEKSKKMNDLQIQIEQLNKQLKEKIFLLNKQKSYLEGNKDQYEHGQNMNYGQYNSHVYANLNVNGVVQFHPNQNSNIKQMQVSNPNGNNNYNTFDFKQHDNNPVQGSIQQKRNKHQQPIQCDHVINFSNINCLTNSKIHKRYGEDKNSLQEINIFESFLIEDSELINLNNNQNRIQNRQQQINIFEEKMMNQLTQQNKTQCYVNY